MIAMTLPALANASPARVFNVRDYGAVAGQSADAAPAIRKAVQAAIDSGGPAEVRFESGVYRLTGAYPGSWWKSVAIFGHGAKDLTLSGSGKTTLVITDALSGVFHFTDCEHLAIKNFTIDYDPVPFTQGTITAVYPDENAIEIQLDSGYIDYNDPAFKDASDAKWGMQIFTDKVTGKPIQSLLAIGADPIAQTGPRRWKLQCAFKYGGWGKATNLAVGDRFVHLARGGGGANISAVNCAHFSVDNITMYAGAGLAMFPFSCDNVSVKNYHILIKPGTDRLLSTDADGIHSRGNRHLDVESCSFAGMADDAINMHSSAIVPLKRVSPVEFLFRFHTFNILPGDILEAERPETQQILGQWRVATSIRMMDGFHVIFETPLPDDIALCTTGRAYDSGDQFYNISAANNDFEIRNNTFGVHRAREILVEANGGTIEHNVFEDSGRCGAICFGFDPTADAEGPMGRNVKILDNRFLGQPNAGSYMISVDGRVRGKGKPAGAVKRDILIQGNTFENMTAPVGRINDVAGLSIQANHVVRTTPPLASPLPAAFLLTDCPGALTGPGQLSDSSFSADFQIKP